MTLRKWFIQAGCKLGALERWATALNSMDTKWRNEHLPGDATIERIEMIRKALEEAVLTMENLDQVTFFLFVSKNF